MKSTMVVLIFSSILLFGFFANAAEMEEVIKEPVPPVVKLDMVKSEVKAVLKFDVVTGEFLGAFVETEKGIKEVSARPMLKSYWEGKQIISVKPAAIVHSKKNPYCWDYVYDSHVIEICYP